MPLKADELNWTELTCTAPSWPSYTTRHWPRASRHEVDWLNNRAAVRELRFENWNSVQSSSVICCEHALTLSQSADGELWKGQISGWMGANVGTRGAWAAAGNSLCTCGVRYCVVRHWLMRRPSPCSCCCDSQASIRLETISRKTQPHVAQIHWIGSETTEHRSFLRAEEGSLSRTLALDCGHGYAPEECATKRETSLTAHVWLHADIATPCSDRKTFRTPALMSKRTIRIPDVEIVGVGRDLRLQPWLRALRPRSSWAELQKFNTATNPVHNAIHFHVLYHSSSMKLELYRQLCCRLISKSIDMLKSIPVATARTCVGTRYTNRLDPENNVGIRHVLLPLLQCSASVSPRRRRTELVN